MLKNVTCYTSLPSVSACFPSFKELTPEVLICFSDKSYVSFSLQELEKLSYFADFFKHNSLQEVILDCTSSELQLVIDLVVHEKHSLGAISLDKIRKIEELLSSFAPESLKVAIDRVVQTLSLSDIESLVVEAEEKGGSKEPYFLKKSRERLLFSIYSTDENPKTAKNLLAILNYKEEIEEWEKSIAAKRKELDESTGNKELLRTSIEANKDI
jgi:hypothetical protein